MATFANGKLTIRTNDPSRKHGIRNVDLSCLLEVFEVNRAVDLATSIEKLYSSHTAPTTVRSAATVLKYWVNQWKRDPQQFNFTPDNDREQLQVIKNLRASWFQQFRPEDPKSTTLATFNGQWADFIRLMTNLAGAGKVCKIDYTVAGASEKFTSNAFKQGSKCLADMAAVGRVVRSIDADRDSYSDKLIEPISLSLSDDQYLTDYEHRLQHACDSFLTCAIEDMRRYQKQAADGERLVQSVNYRAIQAVINSRPGRTVLHDPETGLHYFKAEHPNHLAHLLAMIKYEMGGIPKPYQTRESTSEGSKLHVVGPCRWQYAHNYGMKNLMPYLGLLTMEMLLPLIVIILCENPRINVESLIHAELEDRYGQNILISTAGEADALRLTVNKPRGKGQKSVILEGYSREAMECLLAWTETYRDILRDEGSPDASKLMLVMTNSQIAPVLSYNVLNHFKKEKFGKGPHIQIPFIARHPELAEWKERATLASLRVSAGVLEWLKSGGDLERTKQVFGHRDARVTLNNYVPRQLQAVMYERMIRRFQNLLICAACAGKSYMLAATDFNRLDDLHAFLTSMLDSADEREGNPLIDRLRQVMSPDVAQADSQPVSEQTTDTEAGREILWRLSTDGLAMLRLYREHLLSLNLPQSVMDSVDGTTGTSPQFWLDLANVVVVFDQAGLPDQFIEFDTVFRESIERAEQLRDKITFPHLDMLQGA